MGSAVELVPKVGTSTEAVARAVSDSKGNAVLEAREPGKYSIVAALQGFRPESRTVELPPGCQGRLRIVMTVEMRPK
jgi:hypothetical protein